MKKIIVTGASGFVGKHLIKFLSSKDLDLYGTYLNTQDEELAKLAKLIRVDLNNPKEVDDLILKTGPDLIFHLAASTSPRESFKDPKSTFENNINSEINILESVKNRNLKTRIIIISSAEVYGIVGQKDLPIDENTPLNPSNPYAVSKIAQDFLALQYFNSYKLNIVRLRPFNHIGPGQSDNFVVSAFAKKIAMVEKGKINKITVGNLESKRDFTDVKDIVRAYYLASEKSESGEVYNLGSGKSHPISEILKMLTSYSKAHIEVEQDKSLFMPIDNPDFVCNFSKFEKITGWKPEIPLEQTLRETLDYWREVI